MSQNISIPIVNTTLDAGQVQNARDNIMPENSRIIPLQQSQLEKNLTLNTSTTKVQNSAVEMDIDHQQGVVLDQRTESASPQREPTKKGSLSESTASQNKSNDIHHNQQYRSVAISIPLSDNTVALLQDGKLLYTEPKLRPENHDYVVERIVRYRANRKMIEQSMSGNESENIEIPPEYTELVAVLAQDSDESFGALVLRINDILSPFGRNESLSRRFADAIERTLKATVTREKYGLINVDGNSIVNVPQNLSIFRWEMKDIQGLPSDLHHAISKRRSMRQEMTHKVLHTFSCFPQEQQEALLHTKGRRHARTAPSEEHPKTAAELELEQEKQRKKDGEKKRKEEEKRRREEEKKAREEERRKREEEKQQREEERKKKEQSQLRLTSLFTKSTEDKHITTTSQDQTATNMFPPFFIKEHVFLPTETSTKIVSPDFELLLTSYTTDPQTAAQESAECRERFLREAYQSDNEVFLERGMKYDIDLGNILLGPSTSGSDPDLIHRLSSQQLLRMKLLQFTENVRPAYYGTWTKSSVYISARNPFAKDEDLFDYDHDSEAEWEPEGEGEEIHSGEEDEDDAMMDDPDADDAGWLVPEGYLSEDEVFESDDDHVGRVLSRPVVRPAKKMPIRQYVVGPVFVGSDSESDTEDQLKQYGLKWLCDIEEMEYDPFCKEAKPVALDEQQETTKKSTFTDQHETELINIIEGKADGMPKLISEAKANWLLRDVPKRQIEAKIKDLAVKEKRGSDTKAAWYLKGPEPQQSDVMGKENPDKSAQ